MRWLDRVVWCGGWCVLSRTRVTLLGDYAQLDSEQAYIFVSNHQSHFDIPATKWAMSDRMIYFVTKRDMLWVPIVGLYLWCAGYPLVDRRRRDKALGVMKKAADAVRNGSSLLVYPEGTRSRDGQIAPFKMGAFVMAIETGVPIVPSTVTGSMDIMHRDSRLVRRGDVTVHVGQAIDTSSYAYADRESLANEVRLLIEKRYEQQSLSQ